MEHKKERKARMEEKFSCVRQRYVCLKNGGDARLIVRGSVLKLSRMFEIK